MGMPIENEDKTDYSANFFNKYSSLAAFSAGRLCDCISFSKIVADNKIDLLELENDLQFALKTTILDSLPGDISASIKPGYKIKSLGFGKCCPECGQQVRIHPICTPKGVNNIYGWKSRLVCEFCLWEAFNLVSLHDYVRDFKSIENDKSL